MEDEHTDNLTTATAQGDRIIGFHSTQLIDEECIDGEVVVAQLAERSLMIPEDPGSNPVIGNFYLGICLLLTVCRRDENKEKEAENGPYFKKL